MNNKLIAFWTAAYLLGIVVTILGTFCLICRISCASEFDFNIFYVTSLVFFLTIGSWVILQVEKKEKSH